MNKEEQVEIFHAIGDIRPARIWDGVLSRVVNGERLTVGFVDLEPDVQVPEHRHENEQVGFVLRGSVTMVVDGNARTLSPGGTYTIHSQVPHSAKAGHEGATVVDVFAPVRTDWDRAPRAEVSPAGWPPPVTP